MQHRIVVKRHRPWFWTGLVAAAAALIAVAGFLLYQWARAHAVSDFNQTLTALDQAQDNRRDLARELRAARTENEELRNQAAYKQRSGEIDGAACADVKASLADLQAQAADLREQIAFYRGIVSPDETRAGVRVLDLKVSPLAEANRWHYELMLIQSLRHDRRVTGKIHVQLIGSRDGKEQQLDLAPLLVGDAQLPAFAFKYFQEFGGDFRLPDGFRPLRASVTLNVDGEEAAVENAFDWSKIRSDPSP